jgi:hypothetical protein
MKRVLLVRPYYWCRQPESDDAAKRGTARNDIEVHGASGENNMTCKNFNAHLAICMNAGGYDYWCLMHGDVAPADGFIDAMLDSLESTDLDVTHCPCRYKNDTGLVMTALGRPGKVWGPNRQLTLKELAKLPKTFDAQDLCNLWDMPDRILLPNTGCMMWKLGDWVEKFPGFKMIDEFGRDQRTGQWIARSVSEDYWFGFWAHENGVKVGGTKHPVGHWGRKEYSTDEICGQETDEQYLEVMEAVREMATA